MDDMDAATTWDVEDDPYARIPHALIEDLTLPHTAVRVYGYLMRRAQNKTAEAFPGYRRISKEIGMSTATIAKCIDALELGGWVDVTRSKTDTGRQKVNHYFVRRTRRGVAETKAPVAETETGGVADSKAELEPVLTTPNELEGSLKRRDELWDVFTEIHGQPATKGERGKYNATVKKLRDADVTPQEYPALVGAFTTKHGGLQPGVVTVAERVGELRHFVRRGPIQSKPLDELERDRRIAAMEQQLALEDK